MVKFTHFELGRCQVRALGLTNMLDSCYLGLPNMSDQCYLCMANMSDPRLLRYDKHVIPTLANDASPMQPRIWPLWCSKKQGSLFFSFKNSFSTYFNLKHPRDFIKPIHAYQKPNKPP